MTSPPIDAASLFGVEGLVAVITGGGTGIGLMMAQALEANGATVYILGRRQEVLDSAAATAKHGRIHPLRCDVTSKPDLAAAADAVRAAEGHADLVVANAGVSGPTLGGRSLAPGATAPGASLESMRQSLWDADPAQFARAFEVNVSAAYFTAVAFLGLLDAGNRAREEGGGVGHDGRRRTGRRSQSSQFIATGSGAAFNRFPRSGWAYSASKAAVVHMAKQLATVLVPHGIRSNAICPGFYPSELTHSRIDAMDAEHGAEGWPASLVPARRAGDAQDMAGAILFLAGRAGAYLNGHVLVSDGGALSTHPPAYVPN